MSKKIDGIGFKNMVEYAVRNLNKHVRLVNQLNVFPVPDGDTGTNMVTTIHRGLMAVGESLVDLPSVSRKFARSVVFEARGNSGVIVSQFLKGISERFYDVDVADGALFIEALEKGVEYAYSAVATPVEGTMLTVVKDATRAVQAEFTGSQSVAEIIDSFVRHAKVALDNTPELLSILKETGVVDSGGAGIVYLFEGMKKYLDGEPLDSLEAEPANMADNIDYDAFDRNSRFDYGYCTELLLQLLNGRDDFDGDAFKTEISALGDSLVVSCENDKVRVHIHTHDPEKVFALCHRYGEFLSSKIENMTVQHTELSKRILCADTKYDSAFSVVAVAYDTAMQQLFVEMGADVVICCDETVSTKDYLDAFDACGTDRVVVFPNSSDAILAAMQAKGLYGKKDVYVLHSRTIAECYAALPAIDFNEEDMEVATESIMGVINNLYVVSITTRKNALHYRDQDIDCHEFYSFSGKELIAIHKTLEETALQTILKAVEMQGSDIITIFYQPSVQAAVESVMESARDKGLLADFFMVPVESLTPLMTISFE